MSHENGQNVTALDRRTGNGSIPSCSCSPFAFRNLHCAEAARNEHIFMHHSYGSPWSQLNASNTVTIKNFLLLWQWLSKFCSCIALHVLSGYCSTIFKKVQDVNWSLTRNNLSTVSGGQVWATRLQQTTIDLNGLVNHQSIKSTLQIIHRFDQSIAVSTKDSSLLKLTKILRP